jgi:hypothetical protein
MNWFSWFIRRYPIITGIIIFIASGNFTAAITDSMSPGIVTLVVVLIGLFLPIGLYGQWLKKKDIPWKGIKEPKEK